MLTEEGKLTFDLSKNEPWIPRERLITPNGAEMDVMVGQLSEFWRFGTQKAASIKSCIAEGDWKAFLQYAEKLYESTSQVVPPVHEQAEEAGYDYICGHCYICGLEIINPNGPIIETYQYILDNKGGHPLYDRMVCLESPAEQQVVNSDEVDAGDRFLENALSSCGSMGSKYPLADSQRRAVHAYHLMGTGEVLAVSGPPGTGKTTMLQSIVAGTIVQHALERRPAPIIVGTSTNNQAVTNIIDSFSSVAPDEHGALDFRWLPRAAEEGGCEDATLPGIAAYCPATGKLAKAKKKYLCEQVRRTDAYTEYSDAGYVGEAKDRLLAYAQSYLGYAPTSLTALANDLHRNLSDLDDLRRRSLEHCNDFLLSTSVNFKASIQAKRDEHEALQSRYQSVQNRLSSWLRVREDSRPKGLLGFLRAVDEPSIIAANKAMGEQLPDEVATLAGVVGFYNKQLKGLEQQAESCTAQLNQLTKKQEAARAGRDNFKRDLAELVDICADARCSGKLKYDMPDPLPTSDEGHLTELLKFDKSLDTTLRYREFWLAIHYYECQWLMFCENHDILDETKRRDNTQEVQDCYWTQGPALTPCFVMTEYQVPKYFTIYDVATRKKVKNLNRIDLLITDEAGQVNVPVAMAGFAFAKRAVVVGDTHQLAPIWAFDEGTDQSIAQDVRLIESNASWQALQNSGLTCSQPSSLMKAATHACIWRYSKDEAGLFLEEHYRCVEGIISFCNELIYNGRLVPSRPGKSKFDGITDPFLYCVVPGSEDKRSGSSRNNQREAEAIVEWTATSRASLERLYGQSLEEIVGIVTPFSAQASLIRRHLKKADEDLAKKMTIGTAHRLQGAEKPVILFSATYGSKSGDASFINNNPELMNVAVSRAKDLFIIFGAEERLKDTGAVFKVVGSFAKEDDCTFARTTSTNDETSKISLDEEPALSGTLETGSPEGENNAETIGDTVPTGSTSIWVDPDDMRYVSLTALLNEMFKGGKLARKPKTTEANRALLEVGLLKREIFEETGRESWFPTANGLQCGIRETRRETRGEMSAYPVYPAEATPAVLAALNKTLP